MRARVAHERTASLLGVTIKVVPTIAERILEAIRYAPLDDDVLARRLGVAQRQTINQTARRLESQGRLRRVVGPDGKIVNALPDSQESLGPPAAHTRHAIQPALERITEDEVKRAVRDHLASQGFDVAVAWDRARGIDIDARHPNGSRHVIEAKAETGTTGAQQVNYFIGMLGELLQRMDDERATYGIALPENRQYRGLVDRLPQLARHRIGLNIFWVSRDVDGNLTVAHEA
jgi:Restriction endonuclease